MLLTLATATASILPGLTDSNSCLVLPDGILTVLLMLIDRLRGRCDEKQTLNEKIALALYR